MGGIRIKILKESREKEFLVPIVVSAQNVPVK